MDQPSEPHTFTAGDASTGGDPATAAAQRALDSELAAEYAPPPKLPTPWVAIFLAVANVAVFGWSLSAGADAIKPDAPWMLDHGGNFGPMTFDGEQWRLLTSMFLHYGLLHLVMNMIGLLDGGRHVERMYGHAGFAALYIVSGLAGSLASGLRGDAVSAGASGAVFGIFGAFGAFLLLHRERLDREHVGKQARGLGVFIAYNLIFGAATPGIDMAAHIGGLAAGFACGLALEIGTDDKPSTLVRSLLVGVVGVALVAGAAFAVPKPKNAFMAFAPIETELLEKWNKLVGEVQAGTLTDDAMADKIENELLPAWRKAHDEFAKDGDGPLREDMLDYIEAREEGWEIIAKGLRAHDEAIATQGMTRFSEGDAIIQRMKMKQATGN